MAKKQKILYLVTQSEWGGAQEYVFNLATNINKNQYEVLVLAGEGDDSLFNELQKHPIPFQKLKYTKRAINPIYDLLTLFELVKIFKKEKPNIIHLNSSKIGFLGSLAAKIYGLWVMGYGLRVIYTAHGWVFTEPLPWLIKKLYLLIEKISAPWKNIIITVSEFDRQTALKHKFKPVRQLAAGLTGGSKIVTIHNAVDLTKLEFLNKEKAKLKFIHQSSFINHHSSIIGTIANLYPTKGLCYLIESANLLIKQYPDLIFVIIGEGEEKENLELEIRNLKLENNVILTGTIPDAHRYLKAFDLFVLPSVKEGLPYTLLKAIAADVPIVSTKVGGIPEIIDNGFLVEPANPQALADKIEQTLNNPDIKQIHHSPDFDEFLNKTIGLYQ